MSQSSVTSEDGAESGWTNATCDVGDAECVEGVEGGDPVTIQKSDSLISNASSIDPDDIDIEQLDQLLIADFEERKQQRTTNDACASKQVAHSELESKSNIEDAVRSLTSLSGRLRAAHTAANPVPPQWPTNLMRQNLPPMMPPPPPPPQKQLGSPPREQQANPRRKRRRSPFARMTYDTQVALAEARGDNPDFVPRPPPPSPSTREGRRLAEASERERNRTRGRSPPHRQGLRPPVPQAIVRKALKASQVEGAPPAPPEYAAYNETWKLIRRVENQVSLKTKEYKEKNGVKKAPVTVVDALIAKEWENPQTREQRQAGDSPRLMRKREKRRARQAKGRSKRKAEADAKKPPPNPYAGDYEGYI